MKTEDQIERDAERRMDRLDSRLLSGAISQADYDVAVRALDADTQDAYRALRKGRK